MATLLAAQRSLLLLLLLLAGLHSASAALIRPLFQVSDEVTYLASLQRAALSRPHDAATGACLSPPDGAPPPFMPAGGKWLFHETGARLLRVACDAGAGAFAPIWLRLVFSVSLVVIAWAAWSGGRLLAGGTWVPAVAALAVATQPVLAKYSGAVAPDSLANACAAVATLLALRTLRLGASPMRGIGLLLWTGLAATLKDSTLFLLPVHAIVLAATVLRRDADRRRPRYAMAMAGASVVAVLVLATMTQTTYRVGPGLRSAVESPMAFASSVAADAITQVPVLVSSAWTSLGGFGAMSATMPGTALCLVLLLTAAGAYGLLQIAATPPPPSGPRVAWYVALAVTACLLQAPVRQVLLETADLHQGRWLFPVTVPVAIAGAMGLERALGRYAESAWPLVAIAATLVMALPWLAVTRWHVTGPAWALDRTHLFLFSTGGLDIDPRRVESILSSAWPAARTTTMALAVTAGACLALLLALRPVSESLTHVRHADHR